MTKYLSIAILITGFLVGNAYGFNHYKEVYYCTVTKSVGFYSDKETGEYKYSKMIPDKRFTLKYNGYATSTEGLEIKGNLYLEGEYDCEYEDDGNTQWSCIGGERIRHMFFFNDNNMKFVLSGGAGYVFNVNDTVSIGIGKCEKF